MPSAAPLPTIRTSATPNQIREDIITPWREAVRDLLGGLLRGSRSDVAILRIQDLERPDTLVLEQAAEAVEGPEIARLRAREYAVPREKSLRNWVRGDPLSTWGIVSYSGAGSQARCDTTHYSQKELNFVSWLKQKAWFPIMLENHTLGLVVLLRGNDVPYNPAEIQEAHFGAQAFLSTRLRAREDVHDRFLAAAECLNEVRVARERSGALSAICACLTSRRGLGWGRVWIFEESERTPGCFRCRAFQHAHAPVTRPDTLRLHGSLRDEVVLASQLPGGLLSGGAPTTRARPLTIRLSGQELNALYPEGEGVSELEVRLLHPAGPQTPLARLTASIRRGLGSAGRRTAGSFPQPDAFFCLALTGHTRRIVLLSAPESDETPSPILTQAFLRRSGTVLGARDRDVPVKGRGRASDCTPVVLCETRAAITKARSTAPGPKDQAQEPGTVDAEAVRFLPKA